MRRWWKCRRFRRDWKRREYVAFCYDPLLWVFIRRLNSMAGVWEK